MNVFKKPALFYWGLAKRYPLVSVPLACAGVVALGIVALFRPEVLLSLVAIPVLFWYVRGENKRYDERKERETKERGDSLDPR